MFKLRIVTVDHCLVKPNPHFDDLYSDFSEREAHVVPIIRIFGITSTGKKGCLFVHGAYPYLSIPFDPEKYIDVSSFRKKLAAELNSLLSSTDTRVQPIKKQWSKYTNYVYKVEAFKAIPFYGYHTTERNFLRIYFYNPLSVDKAKEMFEKGQVMSTPTQVYEAHIPFILKFFIDNNLYGMNFINVKNVQFRYENHNVYNLEKSTTCEVECDCRVTDILNKDVVFVKGHNPGLQSMWDEEREIRRNRYLSSQITPKSSQERVLNDVNLKEQGYLERLRNYITNSVAKEVDDLASQPTSSQSSQHLSQEFANIMMSFINTSEDISSKENENYDLEISQEMSQVFQDIDNLSTVAETGQSSPLDLSISSETESCSNYSDFEETGFRESNTKTCDSTCGKKKASGDFVEIVCDCGPNQCCDVCCDEPSDGCNCDCENGQCQKIPQVDGAFDVFTSCKANKRKIVDKNVVSTFLKGVSHRNHSSSSQLFSCIPQFDGSFDELSVRNGRRKRKPKLNPLPLKEELLRGDNQNELYSSGNVHLCNEATNNCERICREIAGVNVMVPKSLSESAFFRIGEEELKIKRLATDELRLYLNETSDNIAFTQNDCKLFFRTQLKGKKKLQLLYSMCKPLEVDVKLFDDVDPPLTSQLSDKKAVKNADLKEVTKIGFINECPEKAMEINEFELLTQVYSQPVEQDIDGIALTQSYDLTDLSEPLTHKYSSSKVDDFDALTQLYSPKRDDSVKVNTDVKSKSNELINNSRCTGDDECTQDYWINSSDSDNETIIMSPKAAIPVDVGDEDDIDDPNDVLSQIGKLSSQESVNSVGDCSEISDSIVSFYEFGSSSESGLSSPFPKGDVQSPVIHSTPYTQLKKSKRRNSVLSDRSYTQLSTIIEEKVNNQENLDSSLSDFSVRNILRKRKPRRRQSNNSLIEGASTSDTYDFAVRSLDGSCSTDSHDYQYITIMSLEVFTSYNGDLKPNPVNDSIKAVFYAFRRDIPESEGKQLSFGIIIVQTDIKEFENDCSFTGDLHLFKPDKKFLLRSGFTENDVKVRRASDEIDMYMQLIEVIKSSDPDIVIGFEVETLSWGYLLQRANTLNIAVGTAFSRVMDDKLTSEQTEATIEKFGIKITGRIVLNLWQVLRHEITLNMYSYENVHYHVLHERIPLYSNNDLWNWFNDKLNCWRTVEFFLVRVEGCLKILSKLNLIEQNSELARVFGIQFYEVLSRGSQFRVESMMSRWAKPHNYIMVSPSVSQKVRMRAPEFIALTMEPESNFYRDPVVVLDFQSLYPSIIIAYNYCYSTCLGRLEHLSKEEPFEFGCCSLYTSKNTLKQHFKNIHISPNGVAFVKPEVRKGVLPQMLSEILDTRVMVKNAIKENDKRENPNQLRKKLLNSRQLGLKLIANVTYGYTGANYSGRMPCVEIADAIVGKGREALEMAIDLVNNNKEWGGKVIYGDTDSLFVLFPGCSKEEAFRKGNEIAETVTAMNPKPMKLKFEKVYLPCVLQAKKRYVGYSYETPEQKEPIFDAKGIETIRRDTCPAASKILEKSLKILFTSQDLNEVKQYVKRQFQKILTGRISSLQDFIFAREYRGRDSYQPNACVPALEIAKKLRTLDARGEPRKHERVPYVVVYGANDQLLIQLVRQPIELIKNPSLRLNGTYYIERVIIPTLNRVFHLIGEDAMSWYKETPRKNVYQRYHYFYAKEQGLKPTTISQYFMSGNCKVCDNQITANSDLCCDCLMNSQSSTLTITEEIQELESKFLAIVKICQNCNGSNDMEQRCVSIDCPQLFRYAQSKFDITCIPYLNGLLSKLKMSYKNRCKQF